MAPAGRSFWSCVIVLCGLVPWLSGCSTTTAAPTPKRFNLPCRKQTDIVALNVPIAEGSEETLPMLMLFGGEGYDYSYFPENKSYSKKSQHYFDDTWMFNISKVSQHWHKPQLTPTLSPGLRWKGMSTSFDNGRSYVLFGGCDTDTAAGVLDDLWVFTPTSKIGGGWHQVKTVNAPQARRGHVVTTNSTHLLVFGGKGELPDGSGHVCLVDLWALPFEALQGGAPASWSRGTDFPGQARWGATGSVVTDASGQEVMALFGGRYKVNGTYVYFPELWLLDLATGVWTLQPQQLQPPSRDHHGSAVLNNEVYIFGGRVKDDKTADAALNDVWRYSPIAASWTQLWTNGSLESVAGSKQQSSVPQQRFGIGMEAVSVDGRNVIAIFGGETLPGGPKSSITNDIWTFDPSTSRWEEVSASNCHAGTVAPAPPPPSMTRCLRWTQKANSSCDGKKISITKNVDLATCQAMCSVDENCACISVAENSMCELDTGRVASDASTSSAAYVCEDTYIEFVA